MHQPSCKTSSVISLLRGTSPPLNIRSQCIAFDKYLADSLTNRAIRASSTDPRLKKVGLHSCIDNLYVLYRLLDNQLFVKVEKSFLSFLGSWGGN